MTHHETWIFLRGLGRESAHWGKFGEILERHLPHIELQFLDLPGTGRRYRDRSPKKVSEITECLRHDFQSLTQSKKNLGRTSSHNVVVGHSFGGMVASHWITEYPQDFAGACLINTSLPWVSPPIHRLRPEIIPSLVRLALQPNAAKREKIFFKLNSSMTENEKEITEEWTRISRERPIRMSVAINQLIAAATCPVPKVVPEIPVLLLSSLGDRLADPRCSVSLQRKWNCEHHTHPFAGHDIALDDPDWLAEMVTKWRKEQDPRRLSHAKSR